MGKLRTNLIRLIKLLLNSVAIKLHMVSLQQGPLNHSIYHDLGKGHIQWMSIHPNHHKPSPIDLLTKHINCFIRCVPFGIH